MTRRLARALARLAVALSLLAFPLTLSAAEAPVVVVSTKPLHALVAGVMEGLGSPILLLDGSRSPHDYSLRPSDAAALEKAARIFWMGPSLEGFLARPLGALDPSASVALGARLGQRVLPSRPELSLDHHDDGNEAEADNDEHGHAASGDQPLPDLHLWLDPTLAAVMVGLIADELGAADPANAHLYRKNAEALSVRLVALDAELAAQLAPVHDRPFIVFHDAYQYFGRRYDLHWVGSLSVSPEHPPGARHLNALRERIEAGGAVCVFGEPQFEPRLVERLIEGTGARVAILDPDGGTGIEPGPEAYFTLMRRLAGTLAACLGG